MPNATVTKVDHNMKPIEEKNAIGVYSAIKRDDRGGLV